MKYNLIAFTGYGGSGKDEAAKTLINAGFTRCCFGDIIKKNLDAEIKEKFGFSAFTEKPNEKKKIRHLLEQWGEDHYDEVFEQFFNTLPEKAVNTRLCRLREAQEWIRRGGVIVAIMRPGVKAETKWSGERFAELRDAGVIYQFIHNDGDLDKLKDTITEAFIKPTAPPQIKMAAPAQKVAALVPQPVVQTSALGARVRTLQPSSPSPQVVKKETPQAAGVPQDKQGFDDYVEGA